MAGIIDYINQIRNKFQFLKWIQIVPQESLATKKSALYFVEKSPTTAEAIIVDDLGQKRKIVGGSGGSSFNGIETDDSATVTFTGDGTVGNPLIAESLGGGTNNSDTYITTLSYTLNDLGVETMEEITDEIVATYINSLGLVKGANEILYIDIINNPPIEQ